MDSLGGYNSFQPSGGHQDPQSSTEKEKKEEKTLYNSPNPADARIADEDDLPPENPSLSLECL